MPVKTLKLFLALAVSASAVATPAYADDAEISGPGCSFTAFGDPTGLVQQDPNVRLGEVHGGPVLITDFVDDESPGPAANGVASPVTLVCWIQVNSPTPKLETAAAVAYSSPGVGVAVLLPTLISFQAAPVDNVFVCTGFWYKSPDGTWVHTSADVDQNPENGTQCAHVTSAGA